MLNLIRNTLRMDSIPSTMNSVQGLIQIRTSTKRGGGSTKNNKKTAGRRLGPKKYGGQCTYTINSKEFLFNLNIGEFVIPGNIIMRQRGTVWHPGQHVR